MEDIQIQELKERMDAGEVLNIFDVREQYEYDEFNIGAKLIPLGDLPNSLDEFDGMEDQEIILHCRSGARSGRAKEYLESQGFNKVRNLIGGMLAWREAGY